MLAVWKYYKVYEFERLTAENENKKKAEKRLPTQATIESTRAYNRDSKNAKDISEKLWSLKGWTTSNSVWSKTWDFGGYCLTLSPATLSQLANIFQM